MRILLLLLIWPILEFAVFVTVSDEIGFLNAFFLWLAGAIFGGFLIHIKGLHTGFAVQDALQRGEMPIETLFSSICVFFAGVLCILPGFLSSIVAIFLLIPQIRQFLRKIAANHFDRQMGQGQTTGQYSRYADNDIIDADYIEIKSEEIYEEHKKLERD